MIENENEYNAKEALGGESKEGEVENLSDSEETMESIPVPNKYEGMPSEVVEELLESRAVLYTDEKKNTTEQARKLELLNRIKETEQVRESKKSDFYKERYEELSPDDRQTFVDASHGAQHIYQELLKNNIITDELLPEESYIINKLKLAFEQFREQNPDKPFRFKLVQEIDKKILDNLFYRLSFQVLDRMRLSKTRAELGIEDEVAEKEDASIEAAEVEAKDSPEELKELFEFAQRETLESKETYLEALKNVNEVLKERSGLVEMKKGIPTLVLADIHGRRDFLPKALAEKIPEIENKTVFELMQEGEINVVCVGDMVHSEKGRNWAPAKFELDDQGKPIYENGKFKLTEYGTKWNDTIEGIVKEKNCNSSEARDLLLNNAEFELQKQEITELEETIEKDLMEKEMVRGLGVQYMAAELMTKYENFQVCRGNHDDIKGEFSFVSKYANEGKDTLDWTENNFGNDYVDEWEKFEQNLPLMVVGDNTVISHTSGKESLTLDEIRSRDKKAKKNFMWSDNRNIPSEELVQQEEQLRQSLDMEDAVHMIGHRLVDSGNYREQCEGKLIQVCDDEGLTVAFIPVDRDFDPEHDIKKI